MIAAGVRRGFGVLVVAGLMATAVVIHRAGAVALYQTSLATGVLLFALVAVAGLFNGRKKVPFLPLGTLSDWLTFHIVVGVSTIVVYAIHTDGRLPNGVLEVLLAGVFWLVILTGFVGWFLSRWLPPRLARRGENVLFERIGAFRERLRADAESLVLRAAADCGSTAIADFYERRLALFFDRPRHFWSHLLESTRPRHTLLADVTLFRRYLNVDERRIMDEMEALIGVKDDLDYQYAGQAILKYWLFAHIPLTYALLLLGVVHGTIAGAFSGGLYSGA